ncbi:transglycosylase domain-containing protein [Janibacter sp. G56]|uniref:transglycosylase domain-containing protein n=1 Tax=Janibacter sp. G56 TaxID=3418717 RepID=UPI003CFC6F1A
MSSTPTRAARGARRSRRPRRPWLRRAFIAVLLLGILGVGALVTAYAMTDTPEPNDAAVAQASVLYYSDGKTEMDRIAKVNRESVDITQIPDHVQKAFLAAEDRNFYRNQGISPSGIARAVWVGLRGGATQGGSTITQQYVKNYFLSQDQTITRKAREILISLKIDGELSKDQILEDYLNTIYFGRGADGIQTASQAYFNKDVEDLTVSEGALLASVIRGPSLYDPSIGAEQKKLAQDRVQYVLDGMESEGWISPGERAKATFPKVRKPDTSRGKSNHIGFITEMVREEMRSRLKLTDAELDRGGYRIVTTIDKKAEDAAVAAVKAHMPTGEGTSDLHVGLASIQPGDGAIRALYGGARYGGETGSYFNTATDASMQAGSTFKVFTLLAALDSGIPLSTQFPGYSPQYIEEFKSDRPDATEDERAGKVVNFNDHQYGTLDLRQATALSANTAYARLNVAATPKKTKEMADAAGVTTDLGANYSNVFGTDNVRVLDMANAYATISAEGMRARPYVIAKVTGTGNVELDYKAKPSVKRTIKGDVARDAIQAMSQVISSGGTGAYATQLGRPAAGKTGTTSDNYAAWFDGFTPGQLSTAVGIYKGDGSLKAKNQMHNVPGVGELTGGTVPVQIWTQFMMAALEGVDIKPLPAPGNVQPRQQDIPSTTTTQAPLPPSTTVAPQPTTTQPTTTSSSSTTTSSTTTTTTPSSTTTSSTTTTTAPPSTTSTPPPSEPSTTTPGTGKPTTSEPTLPLPSGGAS